MGFERDGLAVACGFQRAKLRGPVDVALIDGRPLPLARRVRDNILYVAMMDTVFRQDVKPDWEYINLSA